MATKTIDRAAAIKKIGQMMLESWKMMAVSCPLCHTCLMQKQETGKELQIFCPGCDLPIKVQSSSGDSSSPSPSPSASRTGDVSTSNDGKTTNGGTVSSGGKGELEGGRGGGDGDGSARPVLNNDSKINSDTSSRDNSNSGSSRYSSANLSSDASDKPSSFTREPSLEEAKKEYDRKNKQKDLISSKMGSYMMRGWAMMDRTCRNSCHVTAIVGQDKDKDKDKGAKSEPCTLCVNTPLMRSNDKSVFLCVCCGEESAVATYDDIVTASIVPPSPPSQQLSAVSSSAVSKTSKTPLNALTNSNQTKLSEDSSSLFTTAKSMMHAPHSADYSNDDDNDDDDMEMMEGYNAYDPDFDFEGGSDDGWVQKSSSLISLALLEGWHMLSEICPNGGCNVPLVSCTNSSGVLVRACVICDNMDSQKLKAKGKVVVSKTKDISNSSIKTNGDNKRDEQEEKEGSSSDDDSSTSSVVSSSSSSSSKASTSSSTSSSSFSSTTSSEEEGTEGDKRRPLVGANKSSHFTSAANKSRNSFGSLDARTNAARSNHFHAATPTTTNSNTNATSAPLRSKVLNALDSKLKQCTDRLGDPTISTKEAIQLAKLMKNLADAIKSSLHMLD